MKKIFFILLIYSNSIFSQENPNLFLQNLCEYNTLGKVNSEGVDMLVQIPCDWKEVSDLSEQQTKFGYTFGNNTVSEIINIKTLDGTPTKSERDQMLSQSGLKEICKSLGTLISVKNSKIGNVNSGEIFFKKKFKFPLTDIYLYSLQYYIVIKDKLIIIGYSVGTPLDVDSKKIFSEYKESFQKLIKLTKFNEW